MKPLCVLLHGYPNNSEVWRDQIKELNEKYEVLNLSLPGSEDGKLFQGDLDLQRIVSTITGQIESHHHKKIILIGHDIGSFVLSEVAHKLGSKVTAQVYLAGMDFPLFKKQLRTTLQAFKSWYVILLQIPLFPERIRPFVKKFLAKRIYKDSPDLSTEAPFGFSPIAIYRQLMNGMKTGHRAISQTPTLFLFGKNDRYILPPRDKNICKFYEKAELAIIPGGHWFLRENPGLVNQKISNFLEAHI